MLKTLKKVNKEILWALPINTKFCLTNLDALGFPKGVPLNNNLFDHEQKEGTKIRIFFSCQNLADWKEGRTWQFLIDIYPVDSAEFIIPLYTTGFSLQDLPLEGKLPAHLKPVSAFPLPQAWDFQFNQN